MACCSLLEKKNMVTKGRKRGRNLRGFGCPNYVPIGKMPIAGNKMTEKHSVFFFVPPSVSFGADAQKILTQSDNIYYQKNIEKYALTSVSFFPPFLIFIFICIVLVSYSCGLEIYFTIVLRVAWVITNAIFKEFHVAGSEKFMIKKRYYSWPSRSRSGHAVNYRFQRLN